MKAILTRTEWGPAGVFGWMRLDNGFTCRTVERVWAEDQVDLSCIRPGPTESPRVYACVRRYSPKHQALLYHLDGDDARTAVEIHAANWSRQMLGCIAVGTDVATIEGTRGVTLSRQTLLALEVAANREPFDLNIEWAPGVRYQEEPCTSTTPTSPTAYPFGPSPSAGG